MNFRCFLALCILLPGLSAAHATPESATPLTLRAAVHQSITQHPLVLQAQESAVALEKFARGAGNQPNPQVNVLLYQDSSNVNPSLTQPLEVFGQPGLRGRAAWADARSSRASLAFVRLQVARKTGRAYYDYWTLRRSVWVRQTFLSIMQQLAAETTRLRKGSGAMQAFLGRAQLEVSLAEAQLGSAREDEVAARALLNAALGVLGNPSIVLPNDGTPDFLGPPSGFDHLPALDTLVQMSSRRADVVAAEEQAGAAAYRSRLSSLNQKPGLQIGAQAHPVDVHRVFPLSGTNINFTMQLPLWDWGQLGAERQRERYNAAAALRAVEARKLEVQTEVYTTWHLFLAARASRDSLVQSMGRQPGLQQEVVEAHRGGLMPLDTAINTAKSSRDATLEFIKAQAGAHRAKIEAWWAAGGDLEPAAKSLSD